LKLFIREKEKGLNKLNGFFFFQFFCIYDKQEESMFLARRPVMAKTLLYLFDEINIIFASVMKSILQYGIEKSSSTTPLHFTSAQLHSGPDTYFQM
jgi:asparagine synthase (glutamine-hydrolysing)